MREKDTGPGGSLGADPGRMASWMWTCWGSQPSAGQTGCTEPQLALSVHAGLRFPSLDHPYSSSWTKGALGLHPCGSFVETGIVTCSPTYLT